MPLGLSTSTKRWPRNIRLKTSYHLVREGKWTFDKMNELCAGIYQDLNGNQIIDAEDAFGMALNSYSWQPLFYRRR